MAQNKVKYFDLNQIPAFPVANLLTGGVIGTAPLTVDINNYFILTQTTVGQTITLPTPTATGSRVVFIKNSSTSTASFTVYGSTLQVGQSTLAIWDGSVWTATTTPTVMSIWSANTDYATNAVVAQGNRLIKRIATGTSGATFNATEAALWVVLSNSPVAPWIANQYYYATEPVTYAGRTLQKIVDGVTNATFNATESALWTIIDRQVTTWVTGLYYEVSDLVIFSTRNKDIMLCTVAHLATATPELDFTNFTPLTISGDARIWTASQMYYIGDLVTNNGLVYRRQASGISAVTFTAIEQLQWLIVGTSSTPLPVTTQTKTASFTIQATDEIVEIVPASVTVVTMPNTMPIGKRFTFHGIVQATNTVTFTPSGGATIVSPSTLLPVASFQMTGTAGQYYSLIVYLDKNNNYQIT